MKRTRNLTCKDKKQHPNKKSAEDAMWSYSRRNVGGMRLQAEAYKCGDHWHWGHFRNSKKKRR